MKLQELIDLTEEHRLVKVFCGIVYLKELQKEINDIDLSQFTEIINRNWSNGLPFDGVPFSCNTTVFRTHLSKLEIIWEMDFDSPILFPELGMATGNTLRSSEPVIWIPCKKQMIDNF